jgi:hypothetical protein
MNRAHRSDAPAWRRPLIIAVVALAAVATGVLFALLLNDTNEVGGGVTPSPSPSAPAETPAVSPDASESPVETPVVTPEPAETLAPTPVPTDSGPPPVVQPPAEILPPGSIVRVAVDGLRVREEPTTGAPLIETVGTGGLLAVGFSHLAMDWGPVEADGFTWYPVRPLGTSELPPVPTAEPYPDTNYGWVAVGDASGDFVELVRPRCQSGEPTLEIIESLHPWERLACYGSRTLTLEGVFGCGGCGGLWPGTFEPAWLAHPFTFDLLSVDPSERIGPFNLHFSPDGPQRPEPASIIRVTGHFDDPSSPRCSVAPGEPPQPISALTAQFYCQSRFVVESIEVLGTDPDFPFG